MFSSDKKKNSILEFLNNEKDQKSDISIIAKKLKFDYDDCVVYCEDIIEKELVDAEEILSKSISKNKTLILLPAGRSFLRHGGFVKQSIITTTKTILSSVIPALALAISLVTMIRTNKDRSSQDKKWSQLNEPRMDLVENKILPWLQFNNVTELKNYNFGYNIDYSFNTETGKCTVLSYLTARNRVLTLTRYKLFTIREIDSLKYLWNITDSLYILKNFMMVFNFKNDGNTPAYNFNINVYTKLSKNETWHFDGLSRFTPNVKPGLSVPHYTLLSFPVYEYGYDTVYLKVITSYFNSDNEKKGDTTRLRYCFSDDFYFNLTDDKS